MDCWLTVHTALLKNLSSIPSTHFRELITVCNWRPLLVSSGTTLPCINTYRQTHIHIIKKITTSYSKHQAHINVVTGRNVKAATKDSWTKEER